MIRRLFRHLFITEFYRKRVFPKSSLNKIEATITEIESKHRGDVFFVVENALSVRSITEGKTARQRAIEVFAEYGVWDTEKNTGILLYLLMADKDIEIIADRGINAKVNQATWEAICQTIESAFKEGEFESGVVDGLKAMGALLDEHFPSAEQHNPNELSNKPVFL